MKRRNIMTKDRFPKNDECDSWIHIQHVEYSKRLNEARSLTRSLDNDCWEYNLFRTIRREKIERGNRKKIWRKIY